MTSTVDLLNRLRHFVRAEAETQYAALDQLWSRPLAERVAKEGYAEAIISNDLMMGVGRAGLQSSYQGISYDSQDQD